MKLPCSVGIIILSYFVVLALNAQVINEISASNDSILFDFENDSPDWIELFNTTETTINLTHYFLTDDKDNPRKWAFPQADIQPLEFLTILCSGKDTVVDHIHTGFKLSADGEFIGLYNSLGILVDSLRFPRLKTDQSFGRVPNGTGAFIYLAGPTPGASNTHVNQTYMATAPAISHLSGAYDNSIQIGLSSSLEGANIRYILNGAEPTQSSTKYSAPINISRTAVLRASVFHSDMNPSPIETRIFFINEDANFFQIPVLALITDPDNLWDGSKGIYANPTESGDDWERPAAVVYLEKEAAPGFSVGAGVRIHGGASRFKSEKKSFRLYFRSEYGPSELHYPLIPSTENDILNRVILRAGFNDGWAHWWDKERLAATYHRDQIVRDLFMQLGYPAAHGDYAHLFINDEYWGLYNMCERYDDDFFDFYVGKEGWDVVKPGADSDNNAIEAADGDMDAWNVFENWYKKATLTLPRNYDEFKRRVDINNFIDFYILNIWAQNTDWPRHNWYAYRERDEQAKWRFLPWDAEYAFGGGAAAFEEDVNMFNTILSQADRYPFSSMLARLKDNDEFARDVVLRYRSLSQSVLSPESFKATMRKRTDQIEWAIPFESDRWGHLFEPDYYYDEETWQNALNAMSRFADNRDRYVQQHLNSSMANSVSQKNDIPEHCALNGNYPNPFNSTTTISYALPYGTRVKLEIYDIHGRRLRTILDATQPMGNHTLEWDAAADGAATGVYLLRMETESFSAWTRMLLLK